LGCFTNINFLAIIFGILFFGTGIRLPVLVNETLGAVANMIGPLYMVIAGMLLGNVDFKKVLTYKRVYIVSFFRMILYPVFALLLLKATSLSTLVPEGTTTNLWTECGKCKYYQHSDNYFVYYYDAFNGNVVSIIK
jgi:predicted permease